MQRNQNQMIKKNSRLKLIIALLVILILVLAGLFSLYIWGQNDTDSTRSATKNTSVRVSTDNTVTEETETPVSSENSLQSSPPSYAVIFDNTNTYRGTYGTLKFGLAPITDGEIKVSYDTPNFPETQFATLTTTNIPLKSLKVNEHSTVKEVNIETELKLSNVANAATKDFFNIFNGNDTRVYAYYMNNGNIALAFQPAFDLDQYQVIEFEPTSNEEAPNFEEAKKVMQNIDQNPDIVYADFGTSVDDNGNYRKLKATSISMKKDGGSGTLGFVKVYFDGTVVETSNGNFEN